MGLFFENMTLLAIVAWFIYLALAWAFNSFANRNVITGIIGYLIIPLIGVFIVWPHTSAGTNMDTWFSHAKVLSAAAGALIFTAIKFSERVRSWKWFLALPACILALNMIEAIMREFEIATYTGGQVVDGMYYYGGIWNTINAWSGVINLLLISGWFGIIVLKDNRNTMCWPDMIWYWVIGYDVWNMVYCYNGLGSRGFYALGITLVATVIAHRQHKGSWIVHRAGTLAFSNYVMFTFPSLFVDSAIAVSNAWNPVVMTALAVGSLAWNVVIAIIQVKIIIKDKKNPFTDEIHTEHPEYKHYRDLEQKLNETPEEGYKA